MKAKETKQRIQIANGWNELMIDSFTNWNHSRFWKINLLSLSLCSKIKLNA